jgi:hypothetical protein
MAVGVRAGVDSSCSIAGDIIEVAFGFIAVAPVAAVSVMDTSAGAPLGHETMMLRSDHLCGGDTTGTGTQSW